MLWSEMLVWANVILAFAIGITQGLCAYRLRVHQFWWLKLASSIIAFYWCGLYLFVAFTDPANYDPVSFGAIFIRPAFTITLGIMLAGAIFRVRSNGCEK